MPDSRAKAGFASRLRRGWDAAVTRRLANKGPVPDSFSFRPTPIYPGLPEMAQAFSGGEFAFAGLGAHAPDMDPWNLEAQSLEWAEELHGFSWLRHFRAADGQASRKVARRLVESWINHHGTWHEVGWQPHIIGDRVVSWCLNSLLLTDNAELVYRSSVLRLLAVQARYLERVAAKVRMPEQRLRAALGLTYAGLCLPEHGGMVSVGLREAERAGEAALLPDGGARSRNPEETLNILGQLTQLKHDLEAGGHRVPDTLTDTLGRMAPTLRLLRHGDGGLALFHGGRENATGRVDHILQASKVSTPAPRRAIESGFQRLFAGRTVVIMDTGTPATGDCTTSSHASSLAIEVSFGRQRVITSIGAGRHLDDDWGKVCRATAAHSTLTVGDASSAIFTEGKAGAESFAAIERAPEMVQNERREDANGSWALAAHNGYQSRFGVIHYRRVYLSPDGTDLRGEDTLLPPEEQELHGEDGTPFAVRFHLHPGIEAGLGSTADKVWLTLPGDDKWSIRQEGGRISLEEGIYVGTFGPPQTCWLVTIEGTLSNGQGQVKWALQRETIDSDAETGEGDASLSING